MIENGSVSNVKRTRTFFYVYLDEKRNVEGAVVRNPVVDRKLCELLKQAFAMSEAYSRPPERLRLGEVVDRLSQELTEMGIVYCSPHAEEFPRFKHEYQLHTMFSVTAVVK